MLFTLQTNQVSPMDTSKQRGGIERKKYSRVVEVEEEEVEEVEYCY